MRKFVNYLRFGNTNPTHQKIVTIKSWKLFKKRGHLFIHIPKAAGISFFYGIYGKESLGHVSIKEYIENYGEKSISKLFKFTITRNPYDRLSSAYNYLKEGGRGKKSDLEHKIIIDRYKSFEEFVLNVFLSDEYLKIEHLLPQVYWLKCANGLIKIDYIGRFETLDSDFNRIIKSIGKKPKDFSLPFKNKSRKSSTQEFTPAMIKIVNKVYAEDFEFLGYDKL